MESQLRVHVATAVLMTLLIGVIALFWSYPRLLVYVLLAMVAVLAYGALYLILAARLDPQPGQSKPSSLPDPEPNPRAANEAEPTKTDPTSKASPAARSRGRPAKKPAKKRARKSPRRGKKEESP